MAKSTRHHNQINSKPKKSEVSRETGPVITNLQIGDVETNHLVYPIDAGVALAARQGIDMAPNNIIIENTDVKTAPQPGDGLLVTRKNRIIASLGKRAELVSVVVQAYNRLEKTKNCIESIIKYTTDTEYELVLVDNGSTDGTLDYFKSVKHPQKKVVRVTKNVGSVVPIINHLSGRYFAYICNDTYVTKNWLTNLLTCLKSEDAIGMVVPVISNGSNLQGADITFDTLDEMQAKAALHNISNPCLWHERLRLVIQMALFKREAMEVAGTLLDFGFFHDFADDDVTFRIRRAGYKTVLCKDTFVHHDHIRTNLSEKDFEEFNRSIAAGKKDFENKYFGINAWDDVNNYETVMMSLVNPQERKGSKRIDILGVDVLCGSPILELKNKLRDAQVYDTRLSAFSTDPKYWLDLKTICAGKVVVDRIEHIKELFTDECFDYVILGKPVNAYPNPLELLQVLLNRLKSDGHLLLKLRNTLDILSLFKILGATINGNFNNVYQLSVDELIDQAKNAGFTHNKIAVENWPLDEKNLQVLRNAIRTTSFNQNPAEVFARGVAQNYVIDIARQ